MLKKYLFFILLSICFCSTFIMASTQGSIKEQLIFKDKVLDLLKQENIDAIKDYIESIPSCDLSYQKEDMQENTSREIIAEKDNSQETNDEETLSWENIIQVAQTDPVCTMDRIDGKSFLLHVWQKGFNRDNYRFNIIETDAGLYDALGNYYRFLYHAEPREFNVKFYRNFYKRFIDTWLQEDVELILTNLWQPGTVYRKWNGFSGMTGKNIYTTLYISYELGFGSSCKYIDCEIKLDKYVHGAGKNRLRTILKEMTEKSKETNTPQLLRYIKRSWYHSIAYNEADEEEREYYQGKKHKKMYELLSGDGWDMFAGMLDGVTGETLRREKHNIKVDIWNCMRIMNNAEICDTFEQGAIRNGFYTRPIEYVEPTIEEKMQEMQNQINEKLFMYK